MNPTKFEIMPFGFRVSFKLKLIDYNKKIIKANLLEVKKIIVAASGPATNLLAILLIFFIDPEFYDKSILIYANLLIILFNLLPLYPLDGGRILQSVIHIFWGGKKSKIITNMVTNSIMSIITFIASIAVFYLKNISIFLIIIFLWLIVIKENKKYKMIINAYNVVQGGAIYE